MTPCACSQRLSQTPNDTHPTRLPHRPHTSSQRDRNRYCSITNKPQNFFTSAPLQWQHPSPQFLTHMTPKAYLTSPVTRAPPSTRRSNRSDSSSRSCMLAMQEQLAIPKYDIAMHSQISCRISKRVALSYKSSLSLMLTLFLYFGTRSYCESEAFSAHKAL